MTKPYLPLLALALLGSCTDKQADKPSAELSQLQKAAALIQQSDQGFVPSGDDSDLQTYRQKLLHDAAEQLKIAIGQGSTDQQIMARQLLADIYASKARYTMRQTLTHWAQLANGNATLISYVVAMDRADSRSRSLDTQEASLLAELQQELGTMQRELKQMEHEAEALRNRTSELTRKADDLKQQAGQAMSQSQQTRTQALTASGDAQDPLQDQASNLQRAADSFGAEAEGMTIQASIYQDELTILAKQIELKHNALKSLENHIHDAQTRQDQARDLLRQANESKSEAFANLNQQFDQTTQQFQDNIEKPLDLAASEINEAIELIGVAVRQTREAPSGQSIQTERHIQQERLSHLVTKSQMLSDRIVITNSRAQLIATIIQQAERLLPEYATPYRDAENIAHGKCDQLAQSFQQAYDEALALANSLTEDAAQGDPTAAAASQMRDQLNHCKTRVSQALTNPAHASASPRPQGG
jgi:predicted  nucleic acid-binding Zn-ribbon protein